MEEHGLLEKNRHIAQRYGFRDAVERVPTLLSLPDQRFHLVSVEKRSIQEEEAVGLVVRGLRCAV